MMKFVFVLCVAVVLMHETQAFKVVNIYKGTPQTVSSSAPAFDPSALIQGVQSAIAGKLQQVSTLVGSIVQQKTALKQNALNSIQSTLGSFKSQSTASVSASPPLVYRKSIYIGGYPKPSAAAPEATTTADVDATTTN